MIWIDWHGLPLFDVISRLKLIDRLQSGFDSMGRLRSIGCKQLIDWDDLDRLQQIGLM
jgi:hypothetical protein